MDKQLEEYLKNKYAEQLGNINAAQAFGNLGDVIAGRQPGSGNQAFSEQRGLAKEQTLGEVARQQELATKQALLDEKRRQDEENRLFRQLQLGQQATLSRENMDLKKSMLESSNQAKVAKKEMENAPEMRRSKLNTGDKARLDNALMVLKGLDEMGNALDQGENTFSMNPLGDNPYTAAERRATEAYGRMQSGGAINKEEESSFKKTLPRSGESPEQQRSKIITQREEMLSRLKTLGFKPEELGYEPKAFSYGKPAQVNPAEQQSLERQKRIQELRAKAGK